MSDYGTESSNDLVFDPDQDPEEKRNVRQNYRNLTKKLEEHRGNPNEYTAEDLLSKVQSADALFDKVKGPQEATLDSNLLLMASNIGAQKARAMKSGTGSFDVDDFVSKLLRFMGGQKNIEDALPDDSEADEPLEVSSSLNWDRIGRKALAKSRRVPVVGFMLGPLSIEQKKRTIAKRSKLEKNKDDERKPQELKEEDIKRSENETTKNVAILEAILEQVGTINIFKFIINPNSFAHSVENAFYLAFLVRDGKAAFETQDGEPVIYACDQPSDSDYAEGLKRRQMVLELDMATWKRAIQVFNIIEPVIPPRAAAETTFNTKNQWSG